MDKINELLEKLEHLAHTPDYVLTFSEQARPLLESFLSEHTQKWISVEEQEPPPYVYEANSQILVCDSNSPIRVVWCLYWNEDCDRWCKDGTTKPFAHPFTHWQFLPKHINENNHLTEAKHD